MYQVGGSLKTDALSYIERQCDIELYNALVEGEFCYVLTSRQMGKSSLRLRTKHRLQQANFSCASIDMTRIGSQNITPQQWYKGIVVDLLKGFNLLEKVDLKSWWQEQEEISFSQGLSAFFEEVLFVHLQTEKIFIFIDEIDSVLSLNFSVDDFFALIRFCYNQRAENSAYNRLTFALFGVATPSDLISDPTRTPFNIGKAINLRGFQWREVQPLAQGLEGVVSNPMSVLKEILLWTEGQPFLTQKICQLVVEERQGSQGKIEVQESKAEENYDLDTQLPVANPYLLSLYRKLPASIIKKIVQSRIIDHWESQDEPEHLKTIRNRILSHPQWAINLLELYQSILHKQQIPLDGSQAQRILLLSGLVVKTQGNLKVTNSIYQEVFNQVWVTEQLQVLCPYTQALDNWFASNCQDMTQLLTQKELESAHKTAIISGLRGEDYKFLSASQEYIQDRKSYRENTQLKREYQKRLKRQQMLNFGLLLLLILESLIFLVLS